MPQERSLTERLEDALAAKRLEQQARFDDEMRVRASQVRTLQGMLGEVRGMKCPHCGEAILDPRPIAPDDDYDTRI